MVLEGVGVPGISNELNQAGVKKAITYARLVSLTRQHHELELLVPCWSTGSHNFVTAWGVTPTLEDVARLILLALYRETDAMGIVFEGENHIELKY